LAVAEELPNRYVTDWFVRLRKTFGIEVVHPRRGVTRRLESVLKDNGMVALVCDRDLSGRGVEVDFFGEPTTLPAGPLALARRTGAALIPAGLFFAGSDGHCLVLKPALQLPDPDADDFMAEGMNLLAASLEDLIRLHPEQWHLLQPNWPSDRTLP